MTACTFDGLFVWVLFVCCFLFVCLFFCLFVWLVGWLVGWLVLRAFVRLIVRSVLLIDYLFVYLDQDSTLGSQGLRQAYANKMRIEYPPAALRSIQPLPPLVKACPARIPAPWRAGWV